MAYDRAQDTILRLYAVVLALNLVGIGALAYYSFTLGPLVGPGVESSFGFAVALMFLMGAISVHVAEATYRIWPLGRRYHPAMPALVSDAAIATFVKILVFVAAAGAVTYLVAGALLGF